MRGDDPCICTCHGASVMVSPACAGMIPGIIYSHARSYCEPRMRGDDPFTQGDFISHDK